MKKFLTILFMVLSLLLPTFAETNVARATAIDEQWVPPSNYAPDMQGYYVSEPYLISTEGSSYFLNYTTSDGTIAGKVTNVAACSSVSDSGCAFTVFSKYSAIIPMCVSDTDTNCISSVTAKDANGKELAITQLGQYPTRRLQDFKADPSINLPAGGGAALMDIPGASHAGGTQYLLRVKLVGTRDLGSPSKFSRPSLESQFYAIKTVTGTYGDVYVDTNTANYDGTNRITGVDTQKYGNGTDRTLCVVKSQTECGLAYPIPEGITLGYSLRLAVPVVGWLHGRMKSPVIALQNSTNGGQTISVEANPIHVPSVSTFLTNADLSADLKTYYANRPWYGSAARFGSVSNGGQPVSDAERTPEGLKNISYQHVGTQYNEDGMKEFLLWLPLMKDTSAANPTLWTLNSMQSGGNGQDKVSQCLNQTNSLAGVVTTNSTMYIDGPPAYIRSQGTLDYKVASTHFEPDGKTVFKGTYDLVMSSKVARCIYGFTSAPVSATVSVTSAAGEPDIATTVVSERNGWLSLGAYNFTYSNPTIQVKLTQASTKTTQKQITCIKGKVLKFVVMATCPAGYKKK
jgi:hypothetical protein